MTLQRALSVALLMYVGVISAQPDVINTTSGLVRGQWIQPLGVAQFLGIPYAEAPVGDLRFKPPVRKAWTAGIYNATSNNKICPQVNSSVSGDGSLMTEDCLRLDVYVPRATAVITENPRYPVMVWIFGGGYTVGSSNTYNSFVLAKEGEVIVVTLNYRLGVLGFLNTMDENSVGNFGLRDQCTAIEWVVDNIAAFGGDVTRVTIFGESAGASSVVQLAMSSLCKGKFQRVIAESGFVAAEWAYNKDPKSTSQKFADQVGCPTDSSALVRCLRNKSWQELIDIQTMTLDVANAEWAPSYSGDVFPDNPLDVYRGKDSPALRRFRSLDFLSGVCDEEGEFTFVVVTSGSNDIRTPAINISDAILSDEAFEGQLKLSASRYAGLDDRELRRLLPSLRFQYTDWKNINDDFSKARASIRLHSDVEFNIGGIRSVNLHSANTGSAKTYFYQFKPKGSWLQTYPWTVGATHGDEIYFLFGFVNYVASTPREKTLSLQMIEYWTNFAKTGSPNEPALTLAQPEWPIYEAQTGSYIELDLDMSSDSISAFPYAQRYAFWDTFFDPELKRIRAEREQMDSTKCKNDGKDISAANSVSSFNLLVLVFTTLLLDFVIFYWN